MIDKWGLADWETPFVMLDGDRIIGMVTVAKTDYYPLPDVYPWVSGVFVSEEYRGHRLSGQMIDFANAYLDKRIDENGLLYNIHHPINPKTFPGTAHDYAGIVKQFLLVEALKYNGTTVEVVRWSPTLWCCFASFTKNCESEPEVKTVTEKYRSLSFEQLIGKEDNWDACLSFNYLSSGKQHGMIRKV